MYWISNRTIAILNEIQINSTFVLMLGSLPITKNLIFLRCISIYPVYNSFRIAIGPIPTSETSITRRGLNDNITSILLNLAYGKFSSLTMEQVKVAKDVNIPLDQVSKLLRSHPDGLIRFPLQSHAQLIKVAGIQMLALTPTQLDEMKESYPDYASLTPIKYDPIQFFDERASPPRPLRSKPIRDW